MFALVVWLFFWGREIKGTRNVLNLLKLTNRPWVGPIDGSVISSKSDDDKKFLIIVKNFGQIKAKNVKYFQFCLRKLE